MMKWERQQRHRAEKGASVIGSAALAAGMFAVNLVGESLSVRADDPLTKKALLAYPSAVVAPKVTDNHFLDVAMMAAPAVASLELAKESTSKKELGTMAILAHGLACATNTIAARSGWLTSEELTGNDDGFSAIWLAWAVKAGLDRAANAKSTKERLAWGGGTAMLVAGATVGSYMTRDTVGSKLDATAHASGAAVGIGAFLRTYRRR